MKKENYPEKIYANRTTAFIPTYLAHEYAIEDESNVEYTRSDLVEQLIKDAYNQGYNDASKKINNVMLGVDKDYENI